MNPVDYFKTKKQLFRKLNLVMEHNKALQLRVSVLRILTRQLLCEISGRKQKRDAKGRFVKGEK